MIGSVGFPEIMLILVVVLLAVGPKKLPEFAKFLGKSMRIFKDTIAETKKSIKEELDKADIPEEITSISREIKDIKREIKDISRLDDEEKE